MRLPFEKLVLASNNAGKLREFGQLLAPFHVQVVAQRELNVPDCEEPFETFVENALAKARHASKLTGLPALADDSGLCIHALGGLPGVRSARWAGDDPRNDAANNAKLVATVPTLTNTTAHYSAVLVLVLHPADPQPMIAQGRWFGQVQAQPQGEGGFGYDPYFYVPQFGCTAAQLSAEQKNQASHRGQAMQSLLQQLQALSHLSQSS